MFVRCFPPTMYDVTSLTFINCYRKKTENAETVFVVRQFPSIRGLFGIYAYPDGFG